MRDALESKQISLTMPLAWYQKLAHIANTYGITVQDVIKQIVGENLSLLPTKEATKE